MAIEFEEPITAGTVLIREDIESQNFVTGVSGWEIRADGSAEFNNIVIRGGVSVGGASFYYSGTPGPNTLIASIAASDGTDPFGNGYSAGFSVYDRSNLKYASLQSGIMYLGSLNGGTAAPVINDGAFIQADPADQLRLVAAPSGTFTALTSTTYQAGAPGVRTGDATAPFLHIFDITNDSMADILLTGSISQFGMTWKTPSYTASFASGSTAGTYQALQYRVDAENNLYLTGCFHALTSTAIATIFTLPATSGFTKFRPAVAHRSIVPVSDKSTGTINTYSMLIEVATSGVVSLRSNPVWAINDNFYVSAIIPLGDLT
jgi:hypothetical protein